MRHANSWFTAQEPRFVDAASNAPQRIAPHAKHEEARLLAVNSNFKLTHLDR
ncbi:hypothetical protein [Xanthomonas vasicola]|uniref:hypothetical protein n=1 Tax=Xanthomonas vasicola TaxID=56459 RepID=UPI0018786040|nr:hypothetical protein [Xanthomonas vasicola]